MDGVAQPATAQISVMDTPLDHAHDEAIPLVKWARTSMGHCRPKEGYDSIHYPLRESLLRDRMPFGAVTEANKELFSSLSRPSVQWADPM